MQIYYKCIYITTNPVLQRMIATCDINKTAFTNSKRQITVSVSL